MTKEKQSVLNRFMAKVNVPENKDSCWEWTAGKNKTGYGMFWMPPKSVLAHRASYVLFKEDIPEDAFICHSCDNPGCVNPEHLWIGDAHLNNLDMLSKGRAAFQKSIGSVYIMKREDGTHFLARKINGKMKELPVY